MDENYLDRLLQEVEGNDPLAGGLEAVREDVMSSDFVVPEEPEEAVETSEIDEIEEALDRDANRAPEVAGTDAEISMSEISELDELDELADLDMDSLNFDDIDFDEIDDLNVNINPLQFEKDLEDLDALRIDETYLDDSEELSFEEEFEKIKQEEAGADADGFINTLDEAPEAAAEEVAEEPMQTEEDLINEMLGGAAPEAPEAPAEEATPEEDTGLDALEALAGESSEDLSADELADNLDANLASDAEGEDSGEEGDFDLDSLMNEVFGDDMPEDVASPTGDDGGSGGGLSAQEMNALTEEMVGENSSGGGDAEAEMDDLLAMLGLEGQGGSEGGAPSGDEIPDFEIPDELKDLEEGEVDSGKKKGKGKKSFKEILFGPDEDDEPALTPEEEEELAKAKEEKKQAKLDKKAAKKEEAKKKKAAKAEKTKAANEEKQVKAAKKKAEREAEEAKILEEEGPQKPLNTTLVAIVIVIFLAIGGLVVIGTTTFDYKMVITRATDYFNREKYGLAYREILGVDVKPKDEELEARIYTVMYIERQYESYENYVRMNRPEMALDALLQGLGKYDEHHQEAIDLGIEAQYNGVKAKILKVLSVEFGMSEEEALEVLAMDPITYTNMVLTKTDMMEFKKDEEAPSEPTEVTEAPDAVAPEPQSVDEGTEEAVSE